MASTIDIKDYFGSAQAAWDESSLFDRITTVVLAVVPAIGIVGLPRNVRNRFIGDESLDDLS